MTTQIEVSKLLTFNVLSQTDIQVSKINTYNVVFQPAPVVVTQAGGELWGFNNSAAVAASAAGSEIWCYNSAAKISVSQVAAEVWIDISTPYAPVRPIVFVMA